MTQKQIVRAFSDMNPLVVRRSLSWHTTTGVPFEELLAESRLALMSACATWDGGLRGNGLAPYASKVINNRLADFCRRYHRISVTVGERDWSEVESPDYERWPKFLDDLRDLSDEAQVVVDMVLSSPAEFVRIRGAKKKLKRKLRKEGWTFPKIWATFKELNQAFA